MQRNSSFLFTTAIVIVIGAGLFAAWHMTHNAGTMIVTVGGTPVSVDIASTEATREQGLSGRASLPEGTGMWFVFASDDTWGFWMKDMNFPIDMIWVDLTGRVVSVAASASPNSYPHVFYPSAPARYVLEVPSGFAAAHDVVAGTTVSIPAGAR